jgi:CRP-like cAMP-binding protein
LLEHPFFRSLTAPWLDSLADLATLETFQPGQVLLKEGETATRFMLLLEGRAAVEIHTARGGLTIQTLGPGEVVGWSWLLEPFEASFDVVCRDPLRALVFDAQRLRETMEANPDLGYAVSKSLVGIVSQRLAATRLRLLDLYAPGGPRV